MGVFNGDRAAAMLAGELRFIETHLRCNPIKLGPGRQKRRQREKQSKTVFLHRARSFQIISLRTIGKDTCPLP